MPLPKGQYDIGYLPRFGLPEFANRFPEQIDKPTIKIEGDVKTPLSLTKHLQSMPISTQISDFHCVTTWSCQGLHWQGIRFRDFYEQVILPNAKPEPDAINVIFKCQDGYRARMLLEDLLADDIMLAVALNDTPLTVDNGAPLRLIAPAHYGYKNAKHVKAIGFYKSKNAFTPPRFRILEHERARVAHEERGTGAPGWVLRYLFRPLIKSTIKSFEKASQKYHQDTK